MRTLRARLVLAITAVLAAVLTALALFSARVTRIEFHRFEDVLVRERHERLTIEPVRRVLEESFRTSGSWTEAADRAARETGHEVFVVDPAGAVLGRSRGLLDAQIRLEARGAYSIEWSGARAERIRIQAAGEPLHAPDGRLVAAFYPLPAVSPGARSPLPRDFAGAANRWLAAGAVVAGLAAVVLIAALARRLLGPIDSLTKAARRMEEGDRDVRVPVQAASADELAELARSFNAMADAIARGETLRRNLVGDVAHELRTPLTNFLSQLEAVQDGLLPFDRKTVDSLHDDATLLERLVDDLQDLALADAGQLTLHRGHVSLRDAADRAAAAAGPRAREGGVEIRVSIPSDAAVDADRDRLNQILSNLLANALTHTPRGGRIEISSTPGADGLVRTTVADTGPGIAPEHREHVFDRFYRTDPSRARSTGGTGLGLAIVRQLVRAHGGEASIGSSPGGGAAVSFTLPVAAPS